MKKIPIFLLVILSLPLAAQKNYMALSFGGALPLSDYKKAESLFTNGFAYTGLCAGYSGAYYLRKHIAIGGELKFNTNLTNDSAVSNILSGYIPQDTTANDLITYSVGQWNLASLKVGPQFTYTLGSLNIDAYFFAGLEVIYAPNMELNIDMQSDDYFYTHLNNKNAAFGFNSGLNVRYQLNEKTGIRLFVEYQQTRCKGDFIRELKSDVNDIKKDAYSCKIQLINAGLGLVYIL